MRYSDSVRNEARNSEFAWEAEQVFRREVEPAVLDIEEAVRENRYLTELAHDGVKPILGALAGPVLAYVLATGVVPLQDLGGIAIAATAGAAAYMHSTYRKWLSKNREIQRNELFFCYATRQRLSRAH